MKRGWGRVVGVGWGLNHCSHVGPHGDQNEFFGPHLQALPVRDPVFMK
jgi:hypothetical protein